MFLCSGAAAQSLYVDAVHGDDANTGTSANSAFRTLTRASQVVGSGRVTVLPGRYDATIGEVFPISIPPESRWRATSAVVHPGPASDAFLLPLGFWEPVLLEGFRIENASRGVVAPTFTAAIEGCDFEGCRIAVDVVSPIPHMHLRVRVRDCNIRCCDVGVRSGGGENLDVDSTRVIRTRIGIDLTPSSAGYDEIEAHFFRCMTAVRMQPAPLAGLGDAWATMSGSVVHCATGLDVGASATSDIALVVERATFVNCIEAFRVQGMLATGSRFRELILDGNVSDAPLGLGGAPLSHSIATGGSLTGAGVSTADPMFVDPVQGDYRLRWGSPAIDAGVGLGLDGDLNTTGVRDAGAFEFTTLTGPATADVGTTATYEVRGNPGSTVLLIVSRFPHGGAIWTPYGTLTAGFADAERETIVQIPQGASRVAIPLDIPGGAFVGSNWTIQALVQSSASPAGWALSNSVRTSID